MAEVGVYSLNKQTRIEPEKPFTGQCRCEWAYTKGPSVNVHPQLHCPINIYCSLAVAVLDREPLFYSSFQWCRSPECL
jgi:hypothetical protein